jgi:tRNA pseudouridine-54 N-methylase
MSDFLKNLRKSLDEGKANDAKTTFNDILNKADAAGDIQAIQQKVVIARKLVKPLTPAEIEELNAKAIEEQNRIEEFDLKTKVDSALIAIDERVEKLLNKMAEYKTFYEKLQKTESVQEKRKLIQSIIYAVNNNDDLSSGSENVLFKRAVIIKKEEDERDGE